MNDGVVTFFKGRFESSTNGASIDCARSSRVIARPPYTYSKVILRSDKGSGQQQTVLVENVPARWELVRGGCAKQVVVHTVSRSAGVTTTSVSCHLLVVPPIFVCLQKGDGI